MYRYLLRPGKNLKSYGKVGANVVVDAASRAATSTHQPLHAFPPARRPLATALKWAVVTGATDGIGKAMAFELARKGLDIVLISRTRSKLVEVESELKATHKK